MKSWDVMRINMRDYTLDTIWIREEDAKKRADELKKQGKIVRVVKRVSATKRLDGKRAYLHCVYVSQC